MAILISVIIITKNQKHLLEQSLPTLLNQKLLDEFEIIVVDSGSTDGAVDYIKSLNKVKLVQIPPENFKFPQAFNTGASQAVGEFLVRLSGDVIPQDELFLKELIRPFEDKAVGATYGKYIVSGKRGWTYPNFWGADRFPNYEIRHHSNNAFLLGLNFWNYLRKPLAFRDDIFTMAGACCSLRKIIWQARPFNEDIIAGEDAEYAWFLHVIGYDIVYNPKAVVLHEHREDPVGKARAEYGLQLWQWYLIAYIFKYWLLRLIGKDIFKIKTLNKE